MRTAIAISILLGSLARADESDSGSNSAEIAKLVGTWEGYAVENRGERPDRGPVHLRVKITETSISAVDLGNGGKDMGTGTYRIDSSKETKQIDAKGVVLPGRREREFPGIYEIDGDTLKWCVDNRAKERPTEFRTINGKYLLVLRRKS